MNPSTPKKPRRCTARTKGGGSCGAYALRDRPGPPRCFQHAPDIADVRAAARAKGGFNLAARRRLKELGEPDLSTRGGLRKALENLALRVLSGLTPPQRGNAARAALESLYERLPPDVTTRYIHGACETCPCPSCERLRANMAEAPDGVGVKLDPGYLELAAKIGEVSGIDMSSDEIIAFSEEVYGLQARIAKAEGEAERLRSELARVREQCKARHVEKPDVVDLGIIEGEALPVAGGEPGGEAPRHHRRTDDGEEPERVTGDPQGNIIRWTGGQRAY